jgi:hypothetical protein
METPSNLTLCTSNPPSCCLNRIFHTYPQIAPFWVKVIHIVAGTMGHTL